MLLLFTRESVLYIHLIFAARAAAKNVMIYGILPYCVCDFKGYPLVLLVLVVVEGS